MKNYFGKYFVITISSVCFIGSNLYAQKNDVKWIRRNNTFDEAVGGINGGILIGLQPSSPIEIGENTTAGPRRLFRIGISCRGKGHHINYIAIEPVVNPVVNGEMEFSEVSPSKVDNKWGE